MSELSTLPAPEESPRVKAFVLVFAIAVPLLYAIGDIAGLPLFTYHPGTGQFEWGFGLPRKDEGPAMYWYGWVAMCTLGGGLLGGLAAWLAPRFTARLPMDLTWLVPVLLTPFMIYSLNYYWKW
jgi:hypothetical protein